MRHLQHHNLRVRSYLFCTDKKTEATLNSSSTILTLESYLTSLSFGLFTNKMGPIIPVF